MVSDINLLLIFLISVLAGAGRTFAVYNAYLKKKKMTAKEVLDSAHQQVEKIKKEKPVLLFPGAWGLRSTEWA